MIPLRLEIERLFEPSPFAAFQSWERGRILALCSRSLTLQQRILLQRIYIGGFALAQVAAMFEISRQAASQMHARALHAFRLELQTRKVMSIRDLL